MSRALDAGLAAAFARVALANVRREYPRRLDHLMGAADDELRPRALHPAFYGAYDWHSAVHMHWLLARVLRLHPGLEEAGGIKALLDEHLAPGPLAAELAYFRSPAGARFERPYGWAWLLELRAECFRSETQSWTQALAPLAAELARRFERYLDGAPYPVRAGSHGNSAFACLLALDYARTAGEHALAAAIDGAARRWFLRDEQSPVAFEPSLDDFLSPALVEALLMREVLPGPEFAAWMTRFLPSLAPLAGPPVVRDHADPKQSHLDGLCLSRAWCFFRLGFDEHARRHLAAGMPYVVGGDYAGEHWLATFAALALGERP